MDKVCHFEIPYSNKDRAEAFYKKVFGWQIMDAPTQNPYSFVLTTPINEKMEPTEPGGINGGMYPRGVEGAEGGSASPVIVMQVDSCAQRIRDVEAAGGFNVVGPVEIPNMGIYAQVRDSEDNIVGLWQPLNRSDACES